MFLKKILLERVGECAEPEAVADLGGGEREAFDGGGLAWGGGEGGAGGSAVRATEEVKPLAVGGQDVGLGVEQAGRFGEAVEQKQQRGALLGF